MNLRFISTKTHGYLDYLTAALLPMLPRALGWDRRITRLHDTVATVTTGQSFITDYEMGPVKVLPMPAHLTLDALHGTFLLTTAALLRREPRAVRATLTGLGLLFLASSLTTETRPRRQVRPQLPPGIRSSMERFARSRRPQAAAAQTVGSK